MDDVVNIQDVSWGTIGNGAAKKSSGHRSYTVRISPQEIGGERDRLGNFLGD